jgi:hypothetical protein
MPDDLKPATTPILDVPHAPFIFFENAPTFGVTGGVVSVSLSASRSQVGTNGIENDLVIVAYLRGNIPAMMSLRQAIDQAMLLAAPAQGQGEAGKTN